MGWDAARAIYANRKVYFPLFGALALSALESFGLAFWRVPFMVRTFGWNEAEIGGSSEPDLLIGSLSGLVLGGLVVEWLAKRYKDANVRAATIFFSGTTVCTLIAAFCPDRMDIDDRFRFCRDVRPRRRRAAKCGDPARRAQCDARASDRILPVHVHLLRRDGQLRHRPGGAICHWRAKNCCGRRC